MRAQHEPRKWRGHALHPTENAKVTRHKPDSWSSEPGYLWESLVEREGVPRPGPALGEGRSQPTILAGGRIGREKVAPTALRRQKGQPGCSSRLLSWFRAELITNYVALGNSSNGLRPRHHSNCATSCGRRSCAEENKRGAAGRNAAPAGVARTALRPCCHERGIRDGETVALTIPGNCAPSVKRVISAARPASSASLRSL